MRGQNGSFTLMTSLLTIGRFYSYSHNFAEQSSQPQIMFKAQLHNGQTIIVDDYREAYHCEY